MPYVTQQQIEILDDLAARMQIDADEWVRQNHDSIQGLGDLTDRQAAELILKWRLELAGTDEKPTKNPKSAKKKAK